MQDSAVNATATQLAATTIATNPAQPKNFFSLPGELRNQIYDILHQHTERRRLYSLTFRYPVLLTHVRLISRKFTAEFNKRSPTSSRLIISQANRDSKWYPDVCDDLLQPIDELLHFDEYSRWLSKLYNRNPPIPQLMSPSSGGQLHLRLHFNHVSNLERLQTEISLIKWYGDFWTKISLIYDGDEVSGAQEVATRTKGSQWETDETFIEKGNEEWAIGTQQADQEYCDAIATHDGDQ